LTQRDRDPGHRDGHDQLFQRERHEACVVADLPDER